MARLHTDSVKLLMFDLDGTLVDSVGGLAMALDRTLVSFDRQPVGSEAASQWVGNGVEMLVRRALAVGNDAEAQALTDEFVQPILQQFSEFYVVHNLDNSALFPGVIEALTRLAAGGYEMAVVTNKGERFTPAMLASFELDGFFSQVICGDTLPEKKPDPAQLIYCMEQAGVTADQSLMVGDSINDILAAKAAAVRSVAVPYGYNHGEDIRNSAPDILVNNLVDLADLLLDN